VVVGTVLGVGKADGALTLCSEVLLEPPPPWFTSATTTTISSTTSSGGYSLRTLRGPRFARSLAGRGVRDRRQRPVRRPPAVREGCRRRQTRPPLRLRRRVRAGARFETSSGRLRVRGDRCGAEMGSTAGAGGSGAGAGVSATGAGGGVGSSRVSGSTSGSGVSVTSCSRTARGPRRRGRGGGSGVVAASVASVSASSCGERRGAPGPRRSPSRAMAEW
jgi:hypothetical protein